MEILALLQPPAATMDQFYFINNAPILDRKLDHGFDDEAAQKFQPQEQDDWRQIQTTHVWQYAANGGEQRLCHPRQAVRDLPDCGVVDVDNVEGKKPTHDNRGQYQPPHQIEQ
jgi:hypothetical protein